MREAAIKQEMQRIFSALHDYAIWGYVCDAVKISDYLDHIESEIDKCLDIINQTREEK